MKIKILCFCLLVCLMFNVFGANNFVYAIEEQEYLTVEKLLDNNYINDILDDAAKTISRSNTDDSKPIFIQLEDPYLSDEGVIYYYIVAMVCYDTVITPNGSDAGFYDMNGERFVYKYCGMCRSDDWIDIKTNWNEDSAQELLHSFPLEFIEDLRELYGDMMDYYNPQTDLLDEATGAYNCHSYAWYSQDLLNQIWIKSPAIYFSSADGSYRILETHEEPRIGDIIVYMNGSLINHSVIIQGIHQQM